MESGGLLQDIYIIKRYYEDNEIVRDDDFFNKLYDIFSLNSKFKVYTETGQPAFVNYLSERYYMSGEVLDTPVDQKYTKKLDEKYSSETFYGEERSTADDGNCQERSAADDGNCEGPWRLMTNSCLELHGLGFHQPETTDPCARRATFRIEARLLSQTLATSQVGLACFEGKN